MKTSQSILVVLLYLVCFDILMAEQKEPKLTWPQFIKVAKTIQLGTKQEDVEKKLGQMYFSKKEENRHIIQYSYASFGGEPDFKSIRAVKFVFMPEFNGKEFINKDRLVLSEVSFACYMMIGPPTERRESANSIDPAHPLK